MGSTSEIGSTGDMAADYALDKNFESVNCTKSSISRYSVLGAPTGFGMKL